MAFVTWCVSTSVFQQWSGYPKGAAKATKIPSETPRVIFRTCLLFAGLIQGHYHRKGWKIIGGVSDRSSDATDAPLDVTKKNSKPPLSKQSKEGKTGGVHGVTKSAALDGSSISERPLEGEVSARDVNMIMEKGTVMWDPIVDNLLVFPPGTSMHADVNVAAGRLVLQVNIVFLALAVCTRACLRLHVCMRTYACVLIFA